MDEKDFDLQNENLASSDEHDEKNVQPAEQIQEADAKGADEKVTFEENDKVVVLAALVHNGNEYVYVNEILPDESDVTDVYKVMVVHYEDGTLEKVVDPQLLQELLPQFQVLLEQAD